MEVLSKLREASSSVRQHTQYPHPHLVSKVDHQPMKFNQRTREAGTIHAHRPDAPGPCCSGFTTESTKTVSYYGLFTVVHALSLSLYIHYLTLNPVNTTLKLVLLLPLFEYEGFKTAEIK